MRLLWLGFLLLAAAPVPSPSEADVAAVIDRWHAAAADADEERYFAFFTPDAVFLGTDGTERWTRDEFRTYAHPYFAKGKAWSFRAHGRHVSFAPDGRVAWFDEALATPNLGPCRGSGVLLLQGGQWRIAQYNLSVPIPNGLMNEVKALIEKDEKAKPARTPVVGGRDSR